MKTHAWDLLCLAGALAIAVGLWMAWPPLALLWAGGGMLTVGLVAAYGQSLRREAKKEPKEG